MKQFPCYNRVCVVCGMAFNAVYIGSRLRVTCSSACADVHRKDMQRANVKRYIKCEKYKAYRLKYFEKVKVRRREARNNAVVIPKTTNVVNIDEVIEKITFKGNLAIRTNAIQCAIKTYHPKRLFTSQMLDQRNSGYARRRLDDALVKEKTNNERYMKRQKEYVLPIMRIFRRRYGDLDESIEEDLIKAFDLLFPLLPLGFRKQSAPQLAELIFFHVLKEKQLYDPVKFQAASPLGVMPMSCRNWLIFSVER